MPVKNIILGQKISKEKLQRAKELRREMMPAEKTAKRVGRITGEQAESPF